MSDRSSEGTRREQEWRAAHAAQQQRQAAERQRLRDDYARRQGSQASDGPGMTSGGTLPSSDIGAAPSTPGYYANVTGNRPPPPWGQRGLYSSSSGNGDPDEREAGGGRHRLPHTQPPQNPSSPPVPRNLRDLPIGSPPTPRPGTASSTSTVQTNTTVSPSVRALTTQQTNRARTRARQWMRGEEGQRYDTALRTGDGATAHSLYVNAVCEWQYANRKNIFDD